MMESVNKQVIITTHSPELLKYSELEDILFISRDDNGFSDIKNATDNDAVKPFIDELGVDSVFVNDYLGLKSFYFCRNYSKNGDNISKENPFKNFICKNKLLNYLSFNLNEINQL